MRFKHIDNCLILFNKPNSLQVFSNSFISQYDRMFSSKPHSMQARADQTPAKPKKKKSPQNMTPCITIKRASLQIQKEPVIQNVKLRISNLWQYLLLGIDQDRQSTWYFFNVIYRCWNISCICLPSGGVAPTLGLYTLRPVILSHIIPHFLLFFSDKTMMFLG